MKNMNFGDKLQILKKKFEHDIEGFLTILEDSTTSFIYLRE